MDTASLALACRQLVDRSTHHVIKRKPLSERQAGLQTCLILLSVVIRYIFMLIDLEWIVQSNVNFNLWTCNQSWKGIVNTFRDHVGLHWLLIARSYHHQWADFSRQPLTPFPCLFRRRCPIVSEVSTMLVRPHQSTCISCISTSMRWTTGRVTKWLDGVSRCWTRQRQWMNNWIRYRKLITCCSDSSWRHSCHCLFFWCMRSFKVPN